MRDLAAIPVDLLLVLVLVPAHTQLDGVDFLLVAGLLLYVVLSLWQPLVDVRVLPATLGRVRVSFLARLALLFLMITAAAIIPTLTNVATRLTMTAEEAQAKGVYGEIHDGAIQVEIALRYLDEGRNPYATSYKNTPLEQYGFSGLEEPIANPALDYFVYLPGYLVSSFPLYKLLQGSGLYDQRLVYLAAFLILVLIIPFLVEAPTRKLALLAAVGLNPLLTGPVIIGMNDVMVLLLLVLMVLALQRRHLLAAAILLGLAASFKQSAWFLAPFVLLFALATTPRQRRAHATVQFVAVTAVPFILVLLPFFLWDPGAFFTDVFAYPGGGVPNNFPIRGYTIGNLLVGAGLIRSSLDPFPFWLLQVALGLPVLLLLLRYEWKRTGLSSMLLAGGSGIFVLGFLSRFFQDNYVGFVTVLLTLGVLLEDKARTAYAHEAQMADSAGAALSDKGAATKAKSGKDRRDDDV